MGKDDRGYFELTLLKWWQLRRGPDVVPVAGRQQRLVAALALNGPRPRGYLVGLLWPECRESKALESLRVSMHILSRQAPGLLVNGGPVLSLSELVDVDLHRVRARMHDLGRGGSGEKDSSLLHDLRDAELLPGWYDDWVLFEQTRLRRDRLQALHVIACESLARDDLGSALQASEAAVELDPLYETAVRLLIQTERRQGNNAAALRAFGDYEARLREDTGLLPSEAMRCLITNLRNA
jgi:DNA-binding SARP family transcriptional activator